MKEFKKELHKLHKFRTLGLGLFLFILVFFPVFFSDQERFDIRQLAAPPLAGNTYGIFGQIVGGASGGADTLRTGWVQKQQFPNSIMQLTCKCPYAGVNAIQYKAAGQYNGMILHTDAAIDLSPFSSGYLTFFAKADSVQTLIGVQLLGPGDVQLGTTIPISNHGNGPPKVDAWTAYNIPVSTLLQGASGAVHGIIFIDLNGGANQTVYIDEIAFSTQQATVTTNPQFGPPGTPIPTPTPIPPYFPEINPWLFIIPGIIIFLAMFFE